MSGIVYDSHPLGTLLPYLRAPAQPRAWRRRAGRGPRRCTHRSALRRPSKPPVPNPEAPRARKSAALGHAAPSYVPQMAKVQPAGHTKAAPVQTEAQSHTEGPRAPTKATRGRQMVQHQAPYQCHRALGRPSANKQSQFSGELLGYKIRLSTPGQLMRKSHICIHSGKSSGTQTKW